MNDASACFISIDKTERDSLVGALDEVFGKENRVEELIWLQNTNDGREKTFSTNHEYVEVYAKGLKNVENDYSMLREPKPGYVEVIELINGFGDSYPSIEEVEVGLLSLYKKHIAMMKDQASSQGFSWEVAKRSDPWNGIYQYKHAEYRDSDGKYCEEVDAEQRKAKLWVYRESDWTIMESDSKQSRTTKDPNHPNYRYYQPTHPITGKLCAMPSRGWKGTFRIDTKHPDRNSWESLTNDNRIAFGLDETKVPQQKRFLNVVSTNVPKSYVVDYSDGEK
jgi:adenine-specific DNA-methyltransferase